MERQPRFWLSHVDVGITAAIRFIAAGAMFLLSGDRALFPAALSSAFARTRFTSFFPATSSAFFPTTLVRFVHGRPCAALRFLAADAAFFVASFNLNAFRFCFDVYFFLLPRAMATSISIFSI